MKLSGKFKDQTPMWDQTRRCFFRFASHIRCEVAPEREFGFTTIHPAYNDPWTRGEQSKITNTRIELIHDVADRISYNGEPLKPAWFKENFQVCLDPHYKTAVRFGDRFGNTISYPSPEARPVGFEPFVFGLPNVKRGNLAVKQAKLIIGECKLRAGIFGGIKVYGTIPVPELAAEFVANDYYLNIANLSRDNIQRIVNNQQLFLHEVRWNSRDIFSIKELDYAR